MGRACCIGPVTRFDTADYDVHLAAEVHDFDPVEHGITKKEARRFERFVQYAIVASDEAIAQSGLEPRGRGHRRASHACSARASAASTSCRAASSRLAEKGPKRVSPLFIPTMIGNIAAGNLSIRYGLARRVPERGHRLRHRRALHRGGRARHPPRLHRRGAWPAARRRAYRPSAWPGSRTWARCRRPTTPPRPRCRSTRAVPASWRARARARWCSSRSSTRSSRGAHGARRDHGLRLHGRRLPHDGPRAQRARAWRARCARRLRRAASRRRTSGI